MAAPSYKNSIVWGSIIEVDATHKAKLGLYITTSSSNTQTTVNVEIWFHSMYWTKDTNNTLYADWNTTSASTNRGSVSINNLVEGVTDGGTGWADAGMVYLTSYSNTYNRGTSTAYYSFAASLTAISGFGSSVMSVSHSFAIPALASYTITYYANGGSGSVPGQQTKYYGRSINLASSPVPTKTGYTCTAWNTNSSGTGTTYSLGGSYTANASVALYARWTANTYYVYYDANGGENAPATQSFTYASGAAISSSIPTRAGYRFINWKHTFNGSDTYFNPGDTIPTSYGTFTLVAQWEKMDPQSVYICYGDNKIYARAFELSDKTYIGTDGTFYSPSFTEGSSIKIDRNGVTAVDFVEGLPGD